MTTTVIDEGDRPMAEPDEQFDWDAGGCTCGAGPGEACRSTDAVWGDPPPDDASEEDWDVHLSWIEWLNDGEGERNDQSGR